MSNYKGYEYYANFFNNATPEQVADLERRLAQANASKEQQATVEELAKDEQKGTVNSWINYYKNTILPNKEVAEVEEKSKLENPEVRDLVERAADLQDRLETLLDDGVEITIQVPLKVRVFFNADVDDVLNHTYRGDLTNVSQWLEIDTVEVEGDAEYLDGPLADVVVGVGDVLQGAVDNGDLDDTALDAVLAEYAPDLNDLYQDFKQVAIDYDNSDLESTEELVELIDEL